MHTNDDVSYTPALDVPCTELIYYLTLTVSALCPTTSRLRPLAIDQPGVSARKTNSTSLSVQVSVFPPCNKRQQHPHLQIDHLQGIRSSRWICATVYLDPRAAANSSVPLDFQDDKSNDNQTPMAVRDNNHHRCHPHDMTTLTVAAMEAMAHLRCHRERRAVTARSRGVVP
jgi:hypothetical protein